MPETPRTWTQEGRTQLTSDNEQALREAAHILEGVRYRTDPRTDGGTPVASEVRVAAESWLARWTPIEKASVDVERERMLDLLERVERWLQAPDYIGDRAYAEAKSKQAEADVVALLREHGRLPKEVE